MKRQQQCDIVFELLTTLRDRIIEDINAQRIPDTWDGVELRRYICDKAEETLPMGTMDARRKKAYRNEVITRNL